MRLEVELDIELSDNERNDVSRIMSIDNLIKKQDQLRSFVETYLSSEDIVVQHVETIK